MTNPAAEASYGARLARIYDLAYAGMGKDYAAEAHQVRALVARAGSAVPSASAPFTLFTRHEMRPLTLSTPICRRWPLGLE